jgi:hypothetical protein
LLIHNQTQLPFTSNKGINIQPGTKAYVTVNREFKNKLSSPYSDCLSDLSNPPNSYADSLFSHFDSLNVTLYDQDFCFTICFQDKLIDKCNCSDIITPTIRNAKYCETNDELECLNQFNDFFSKSDLNSLCENACPSQCQSIEYKLGLSTSSFPTLSYAKNIQTSHLNLNKFPSDINDTELIEFCNKGFLKVIISYENLYYTLIDEVPAMTLNDLLGNLGGQLGLFIGISFLSLVELIELIVTLSITVYYQRKGKIIKIPRNSISPLKESVQAVTLPFTEPIQETIRTKWTSVESVVFEEKQEIKPKLNSLIKTKKIFTRPSKKRQH